VELNLGQAQPLSDIRDSASKIAENAARMAALLHFFEGREGDVGLETINQAIQVCLWHLGEFKRLFGAQAQIAPEMADALALERWIHSLCARFPGVNSLKRNYISQYGPNQLRNKLRRDMALSILAHNGRVFFVRHGKSLWIQLNPQFFPGDALRPLSVVQPEPGESPVSQPGQHCRLYLRNPDKKEEIRFHARLRQPRLPVHAQKCRGMTSANLV
jgi:hypothetical protein